MNKVYINCLSSFLPNESVDNEHIEDFLGYIEGKKSRIKSIVLKRNGIKHRYYALNEEGAVTHRNSGMVVEAIKKLSSLGGMHRGYRYFVLCDNDSGSVGTIACFYGSWAIEMSSGRDFLFFRCLSDFFAGSKDFVQRYSVE